MTPTCEVEETGANGCPTNCPTEDEFRGRIGFPLTT